MGWVVFRSGMVMLLWCHVNISRREGVDGFLSGVGWRCNILRWSFWCWRLFDLFWSGRLCVLCDDGFPRRSFGFFCCRRRLSLRSLDLGIDDIFNWFVARASRGFLHHRCRRHRGQSNGRDLFTDTGAFSNDQEASVSMGWWAINPSLPPSRWHLLYVWRV